MTEFEDAAVCGNCKHHEETEPHRCRNRDSVFYNDVMGDEETCWEHERKEREDG